MRKVYVYIVTAVLLTLVGFFIVRTAVRKIQPPEDKGVVHQIRKTDTDMTLWAYSWKDKLLGDPDARKLNFDRPGSAEFEYLEKQLRTDDPDTRRAAARAFQEYGQPRAFRPLLAASRDDSPDGDFLIQVAMEILEKTTIEIRVNLLLYTYDAEHGNLSDDAAFALRAKMEEQGLLDAEFLKEALRNSENPTWRRYAVRELATLQPPQTGAVAAALADPDPTVREVAAETLAVLVGPAQD